jgi:hypothetical protein
VTNQEEARGPRTMNPAMPDDVEIGYSSSRMLPLVALAATTTLISASNAFDWFGDSRTHTLVGCVGLGLIGIATSLLSAANGHVLLIGRYRLRDLCAAKKFILWDSIDISARHYCRYARKRAGGTRAQNDGSAAAIDSAVRMSVVRMSVMEQLERLVEWFHCPGSISREMLRLGYITEKSERASPFRSRVGQTACS